MVFKEFLERVDNRRRGASETRIAEFEKELGAKLPGDYRDFLRVCNGGCCGGALQFKRKGPRVHHVFGLCKEPGLSLSWRMQTIRNGKGPPVPSNLLPIMDDPGGLPICIGCHGTRRGKIYYWDFGSMRLLAPSFTAFVEGISEHRSVDE